MSTAGIVVAGLRADQVSAYRATLEEAYLELTRDAAESRAEMPR